MLGMVKMQKHLTIDIFMLGFVQKYSTFLSQSFMGLTFLLSGLFGKKNPLVK